MILQDRINLLSKLGNYIENNDESWQQAKQLAFQKNPWFIPEFIQTASENIAVQFLQKEKLEAWVGSYKVAEENKISKLTGLVMAGNLPMVGFHDMLCVFISGNKQLIKLSSKDDVLIPHLVSKMIEWNESVSEAIQFADMLNGCEAFIATGSNNSGRYFEYYFGKYPNIIRKNRTSVAILLGNETSEELDKLGDDIQMYFGLGCRNVTSLFVPDGYDFIPLLEALKKYEWLMDCHKYKHNYDYQLTLLMMRNKFYMNNGSLLFNESETLFTAVSQVNFVYYKDAEKILSALNENNDVQCIVGKNEIPFGKSQLPSLNDYADGVDTMAFLEKL